MPWRNELLENILKRLKPIADKKRVELVLESFRPVVAEIDEVKPRAGMLQKLGECFCMDEEERQQLQRLWRPPQRALQHRRFGRAV